MKINLFIQILVLFFIGIFYPVFSQDDNPRWNIDPRTFIGLNPEGSYIELPQTDFLSQSNETRYINTPQGVFAIGPNFRVHPRAVGTQSETPITRHPLNPNILFASANTFQGGGFSTGCYVSTNGGVTWTGNDTLGGNIINFGDPAPVIDFTGRFLMSYLNPGAGIFDVLIGASYSTNNGTTWASTVIFPGSSLSTDKNFSATDDFFSSSFYGRSYTVYTDFGIDNRIYISYTTNFGVSWSSVTPVSPPPSSGHHHQGCDIRTSFDGTVYVCWANCISNGQNSTEDSLGFARSLNGGVSWITSTNNAVNINGIRTSDLLTTSSSVIRANGFPRIDVDRTCGPYAGRIYIVTAEKNFAPAVGVADIVLNRSTNAGASWTRTKVNQNSDGTEYDYTPAVRVDESGAVNVCYYSTRNTPTNDSAEIYLSRSTDGGVTFIDVKVSDHKFKPKPISGTASGYQGDYIGIISGGAGKIFPYWCEDGGGVGRYQAWTAAVDVSISNICEDFDCTLSDGILTPTIYQEFSGVNYWDRFNQSAYGSGSGSARFNCWQAPSGTIQSLITYTFTPVGADTYLTFDNAYAPWSSFIDSLIIQTSTNEGVSYSTLVRLWGSSAGGPLNTVPSEANFTPISSDWRPKIYLLPVGTNKIKLRARSGFGNNLWLDNICIQVLPDPIPNSIGIVPEGMWLNSPPFISLNDTVRVYLHRVDLPSVIVDSAKDIIDNGATANGLRFNNALTGTYYKVVKHRNTIETWSKLFGQLYTRGSNTHFNFLTPANQAFGNNQKLVNPFPYYAMFSGDVDQDYIVDASDLSLIDNAVFNSLSGYVREDLTGDNFVDASDLSIADNNLGVTRVAPPGAEPDFKNTSNILTFSNEAERIKYEEGIKMMKERESQKINSKKKIDVNESREFRKIEYPK